MALYEKALKEILNSPEADPADRAVACNLSHDKRIDPKMERRLYLHRGTGVLPRPQTGLALRVSVRDYFYKRIRDSFKPDFLDPKWNQGNLRPIATGANPKGVNGGTKLARVIDLSELGKVYLWAEENELPAFQGFAKQSESRRLDEWLKVFLKKEGAVPLILEAVDRRLEEIPYEPAWATLWDHFKYYADASAERWLELIGKENRHTDETPHCLILLKYRAGDTGTLVRPTQLEAGWFHCHFPTAKDSETGHMMDLSAPAKETNLLCEYVHQQIPHSSHWTGKLKWTAKQTSKDAARSLSQQRRAHYERLCHFNPELAAGWIGTCLD